MPLLRILAVCAVLAAPVVLRAQREKFSPDDLDQIEKRWPDAKKSNTGIRYVVEVAGNGPVLQPGDLVMVNYTGSLLNGRVFDQHHDKKRPFTFRVDRGLVIDGWDQILQLMRPGDRWTVIVPPELAYGRRGSPPKIPEYATLVFDLEIIGVKREN
jgi:FKBP-type peptidyl-prolyl cis-trans isomerase